MRLARNINSSIEIERPLSHFGQPEQNYLKKDERNKIDLQKTFDYYKENFPLLIHSFKEKSFFMFQNSEFEESDVPSNFFTNENDNTEDWCSNFKYFGLYAFVQPPFGEEWNRHLDKRFNDFSMAILNKGLKNYSASRVIVHEDVLQEIESAIAPFYVQPIQADHPSQRDVAIGLQNLVSQVFSFYAYCLAYQHAGAVGAILTELLKSHKRKDWLSLFLDDGFYVQMIPLARYFRIGCARMEFRIFFKNGDCVAVCCKTH